MRSSFQTHNLRNDLRTSQASAHKIIDVLLENVLVSPKYKQRYWRLLRNTFFEESHTTYHTFFWQNTEACFCDVLLTISSLRPALQANRSYRDGITPWYVLYTSPSISEARILQVVAEKMLVDKSLCCTVGRTQRAKNQNRVCDAPIHDKGERLGDDILVIVVVPRRERQSESLDVHMCENGSTTRQQHNRPIVKENMHT